MSEGRVRFALQRLLWMHDEGAGRMDARAFINNMEACMEEAREALAEDIAPTPCHCRQPWDDHDVHYPEGSR